MLSLLRYSEQELVYLLSIMLSRSYIVAVKAEVLRDPNDNLPLPFSWKDPRFTGLPPK